MGKFGISVDKATLVSAGLATGEQILKALDRSSLEIRVALWLSTPEYADPRFVLSSRRLDAAEPAEAYGLVHDALEQEGILRDQTPLLMILKTTDPFIRTLRGLFGRIESIQGMRLGGQLIGDRFVEAALVYRIR
jgi:hypothetical protein